MELKNNLVIDFDTFSSALTEILLEDSTSFKSIYPGSTANIFVEALSGYAAMLMYRLQTAVSNSFLKTAFSEYSIFSIAEMLGITIRGNGCAKIDLTLRREPFTGVSPLAPVVIPAHTSFSIQGHNFYNKESMTFPNGYDAIACTLYQGNVITKEFTTTGAINEKFEFGSDFTTDIDYVSVYVNGVEWKNEYSTLMDYVVNEETDPEINQVVLLRTNVTGSVYIQFGNGLYGINPPAGSIVKVVYASTDGAKGNFTGAMAVSLNDTILYQNEYLTLYANAEEIGASTGGSDRLNSESLKYIAPRVFASNNRAVRRADYEGQLIYNFNYLDANFWGEYEEALKVGAADNSMMNKVYYTTIASDFYSVSNTFGTGHYKDGSSEELEDTFENNLASVSMYPGSVSIKSDRETFTDNSGMGYLFCNTDEYTVVNGKDPATIATDSTGKYYTVTSKTSLSRLDVTFNVYNEPIINKNNVAETFLVKIDQTVYTLLFNNGNQLAVAADVEKEIPLTATYVDYVDGEEKTITLKDETVIFKVVTENINPIENIKMVRSTDDPTLIKNQTTYYQSSRIPTLEEPIIIEFTLPTYTDTTTGVVKDEVLAGIRLMSNISSTVDDRAFPSKVMVLGWRSDLGKTTPTKSLDHYLDGTDNQFTYNELMQDLEWKHLSEVNLLSDPGASAWGEWLGVDTIDDTYTVTVYRSKYDLEEETRYNKYKIYRLIILGKHGDESVSCTKIGKISLLCKRGASYVDYETGLAKVQFLTAPDVQEVITSKCIGEKITNNQILNNSVFLRKINHFTTEINFQELKLKNVDIDIDVIYDITEDIATIKTNVEEALNDLFTVTQGRIGQSLRVAELYSTVMGVNGVVYCTKNLPVSDIEANVNEILYLSHLTLNYYSSARLGAN